MENPIILNARLKMARAAIEADEKKRSELESKKQLILRAADEATDPEALDKAASDSEENDKSIADVEKEIDDLKKQVADLEKKLNDANETTDPEQPAPAAPNTNSKEGGETRMKIIENENPEVRSMIDFINTKGQKRDGVTSTDIGAIIPKQIIYKAQDEVKTAYNLAQFVDVIKVNQAGGTYATAKKVSDGLESQEELAANPELGKPELISVDWALKTYRGQISASNESLEDATDLKGLINDILQQKVQNTDNSHIAAILKTATAATANDTDGIKDIINVSLDPAYLQNGVIVASQSAFNFLDKLKDGDGRYLMQSDITSPTKRSLLGLPVAIISDTLFGAQGEAHAFIGDAKRFVKKFDREQIYLSYEQYANFGKGFVAAIRADYKAADTAAGYFVTLTDPKA